LYPATFQYDSSNLQRAQQSAADTAAGGVLITCHAQLPQAEQRKKSVNLLLVWSPAVLLCHELAHTVGCPTQKAHIGPTRFTEIYCVLVQLISAERI
jgi:uncharacterized membrane protein YjfL (UPF0719 family)